VAESSKGKILLGITGSIAAYKSATLIRLLIKQNYEVRCIMTESATKFISPFTISTLSRHEVYIDYFKEDVWQNHVELGLWADLFIIAPLTASTLSKLANGQSDNMLVTTYLSAKCKVALAPAMDLDMWKHSSTQRNIQLVQSYGNDIIPVGYGELASGLVGEGRMAEPESIVDFVNKYFNTSKDLVGKKVLVTAGPTHEHIDPVRFIGNNSSGKMGIAIAKEASRRGAEVTLILGPIDIKIETNITIKKVTSAKEMYAACEEICSDQNIIVFAAAVADYAPKVMENEKIKKTESSINIELQKTIDIAASIGKLKKDNQLFVGFALETNNEKENAIAKINKKNFDFIVLNSLKDKGAGFGVDTNKITIIHKSGVMVEFPLKPKTEVAKDIINEIVTQIKKK
jgi:phosphopantothenoylcysteine decarboxylase/phosphopantothenate--cysteine ligase